VLLSGARLSGDWLGQVDVAVEGEVVTQNMSDVVLDLVEAEGEEHGLCLEVAHLQDEQDAVGQGPVTVGDGAFFRGEGKVIDSLIVCQPRQAVEILDLLVVEYRDAVFVLVDHCFRHDMTRPGMANNFSFRPYRS
jgi:hypothetical protein